MKVKTAVQLYPEVAGFDDILVQANDDYQGGSREQETGKFSLAECPINEIERFDVVQGYAAEWRKAFGLIPKDLSLPENLALAKKFSPTAKQHEAAITATLTEIKNRRIEIMRPAADKLAVAETLDRAEKVLDELLAEIKRTRQDTEGRVKSETDRQKEAVLKTCLADISKRTKNVFDGPLDVVQHQDCLPALVKAGKGKRTLETYSEAVYAEAEEIIAKRSQLAALCSVNLDLINAAELPAVLAVADTLMQRPTAEVQSVIARRQAEAEAAALKKQAAVQRNQERLTTNKAAIERISNLQHLDNWRRDHKARVETELPHPDDQAELWQFFGAHYTRVESRKKPPHHAGPERETSSQSAQPATPPTGERPLDMPENGLAFTMAFWCGQMDTAGAQGLYERICDLVEADGGVVFSAERI